MNSRREPCFEVMCGCELIRRGAGDGWWLYEVLPCPRHRELPARFWTAPCRCITWSDGARVSCPRHVVFSPIQRNAGGLQ